MAVVEEGLDAVSRDGFVVWRRDVRVECGLVEVALVQDEVPGVLARLARREGHAAGFGLGQRCVLPQ